MHPNSPRDDPCRLDDVLLDGQQSRSGPHILSPEQRQINIDLRQRLQTIFPIDDPSRINDEDLVFRFLIAAKWDVTFAENLLRDYITWRSTNNVNDVVNEVFHTEIPLRYLCGFHGRDRFGNPVYFERPSQSGIRELMRQFDLTMLQRWHVYTMEKARRLYKSMGVDRVTVVLDLQGIGLSVLMDFKIISFLKENIHLDQRVYPEHLRTMIIINAPSAFTMVWKGIQPMLDERVRQKINICNRDYKETLSKFIPLEELPQEFGGLGGQMRWLPQMPDGATSSMDSITPTSSPMIVPSRLRTPNETDAEVQHNNESFAFPSPCSSLHRHQSFNNNSSSNRNRVSGSPKLSVHNNNRNTDSGIVSNVGMSEFLSKNEDQVFLQEAASVLSYCETVEGMLLSLNPPQEQCIAHWFRDATPFINSDPLVHRVSCEDIGHRLRVELLPGGDPLKAIYWESTVCMPALPEAQNIMIHNCNVGFQATVEYDYYGGFEGQSQACWLRSCDGLTWELAQSFGQSYNCTADDVFHQIKCLITPVREDGCVGEAMSSVAACTIPRSLRDQVISSLTAGYAHFKVKIEGYINGSLRIDHSEINLAVDASRGKRFDSFKWNAQQRFVAVDDNTVLVLSSPSKTIKLTLPTHTQRTAVLFSLRVFHAFSMKDVCSDLFGAKIADDWSHGGFNTMQKQRSSVLCFGRRNDSSGRLSAALGQAVRPSWLKLHSWKGGSSPLDSASIAQLQSDIASHGRGWVESRTAITVLLFGEGNSLC